MRSVSYTHLDVYKRQAEITGLTVTNVATKLSRIKDKLKRMKKENPVLNWAYSMLSQLYIGLPFALLNVLAFHNDPASEFRGRRIISFQWLRCIETVIECPCSTYIKKVTEFMQ